MKFSVLLGSLGVVGAVATGQVWAAGAVSTFDTDADGWLVTDFGAAGGTAPTWLSAGLVQAHDVYGWNVLSAPTKFLGNQLAAYGGALSFDLQDTSKDSSADTYFSVQLVGGGLALSWFGGSPSTTELTHFSATLSEADGGWRVGPCTVKSSCAAAPTAAQFQSVLASMDRLQINADWHTGGDDVRLDNVVLAAVPEPETWALMLLGLAAVGRTLRRRG